MSIRRRKHQIITKTKNCQLSTGDLLRFFRQNELQK